MNDTKFCPKCQQEKSKNDFSIDRHHPSGLYYSCKECRYGHPVKVKLSEEEAKRRRYGRTRKWYALNGRKTERLARKNEREKERYKRKRHSIRERVLKKMYNLPDGWYENRMLIQKGKCSICQEKEKTKSCAQDKIKNLAVDHNHETGQLRGLLCHRCNTGIGSLKDNKFLLYQSLSYLEEYDNQDYCL